MSAPGARGGEAGSDRVAVAFMWMVSTGGRVARAWRRLSSDRRLAAGACFGLFLSLFLPWYQETVFAPGVKGLRSLSTSLTGWGAFSFVEAAVLVTAAAVLALLFRRAEGRAFHVPGGDGGVITAAGAWTCVLIVWRMFDKEGTSGHGQFGVTSGIEWGIFVALAVAGLLTYAGTRIRRAREPEPPLPGEAGARPARRRGPDMGADGAWTQAAPRPAGGGRPASVVREPLVRPVGAGDEPTGRPVSATQEPLVRPGGADDEPLVRRVAPAGPPAAPAGSSADPAGSPPTPAGSPAAPARSPAVPARSPAGPARSPAGPEPRRRIRPRSVSRAAGRPALDPDEIRTLNLAEPPTARLSRISPPGRAAGHDGGDETAGRPADDQLTLRLDESD